MATEAPLIRVLIADDHAIRREGLRVMIRDEPDLERDGDDEQHADAGHGQPEDH